MKHLFHVILITALLVTFIFLTLNSCGGKVVITIVELVMPINGENVQPPITFGWTTNVTENVEGTLTVYRLGGMSPMKQDVLELKNYRWDSENYDPEALMFKLVAEFEEWMTPGTYGWTVQAMDRNGNNAESDMATFIILKCCPDVDLIQPENFSEDVGTDDTLNWNATPCLGGTLTYDLHVSYLNPGEEERSTEIRNLQIAQYPIENLPVVPGAIVIWSVTAYEENAGSETSSSGTFMMNPEEEEQSNPPDESSADLSCASDSDLTAEEFLYLLKKYIKEYRKIKIFIDSCFSGGIRKVLEDSDLDNIIVKTSSRWCEKSWTHTGTDGKKRSLWMEKLLEALKKGDWTLKKTDDRSYKAVTKIRNNQHPTGYIPGDLENERLRDKGASSHHVLLVSGNCKNIENECENDLKNWWETLKKRGFTTDEIASITNAATSDILNKLKDISSNMNENEEFIFIFTGHGSKGQEITKKSSTTGNTGKNFPFSLYPSVLEAMDSAISSPALTLSATTSQDCEVTMTIFLNEVELGNFRVTNDESYPYRKFRFSKDIVMPEDNVLTLLTEGNATCLVNISDVVVESGTVPKEGE